MKKLLYIYMMLNAMTIALGHSFVPHHEHGFEIHLSVECSSSCDSDKSLPQECISKINEAILLSKEDSKCSCGERHDSCSIPVFTLLSSFSTDIPIELSHNINYESWETFYSNLYTSTYIPQSKGLRAPPFC